jgi:hypothetical protein
MSAYSLAFLASIQPDLHCPPINNFNTLTTLSSRREHPAIRQWRCQHPDLAHVSLRNMHFAPGACPQQLPSPLTRLCGPILGRALLFPRDCPCVACLQEKLSVLPPRSRSRCIEKRRHSTRGHRCVPRVHVEVERFASPVPSLEGALGALELRRPDVIWVPTHRVTPRD